MKRIDAHIPAGAQFIELGDGNALKLRKPFEQDVDVGISNPKEGKTQRQLGGLFANWKQHIADETGESIAAIHVTWKELFLEDIYKFEPMSDVQEMWVELTRQNPEKYRDKISLSWAKLPQVSQYMDNISKHYIAEGYPLPEMNVFHKAKKIAMRTGKIVRAGEEDEEANA